METHEHPREHGTTSSSTVAIVAIAVILLLAVIAFFVLVRPGSDIAEEQGEPDIELEIEPPGEAPQVPGLDEEGGDGEGETPGSI